MSHESVKQDFSNHVVVPRGWLAACASFAFAFVLSAASAFWLGSGRGHLLLAAAVVVASGTGLYTLWIVRGYALRLQDRIIRAEMRVRLDRILPSEDRGLVNELSLRQLIAVRFASDAELPELIDYVLAQGLEDSVTIKKRIKHWQADHLRV